VLICALTFTGMALNDRKNTVGVCRNVARSRRRKVGELVRVILTALFLLTPTLDFVLRGECSLFTQSVQCDAVSERYSGWVMLARLMMRRGLSRDDGRSVGRSVGQ